MAQQLVFGRGRRLTAVRYLRWPVITWPSHRSRRPHLDPLRSHAVRRVNQSSDEGVVAGGGWSVAGLWVPRCPSSYCRTVRLRSRPQRRLFLELVRGLLWRRLFVCSAAGRRCFGGIVATEAGRRRVDGRRRWKLRQRRCDQPVVQSNRVVQRISRMTSWQPCSLDTHSPGNKQLVVQLFAASCRYCVNVSQLSIKLQLHQREPSQLALRSPDWSVWQWTSDKCQEVTWYKASILRCVSLYCPIGQLPSVVAELKS